MNDRELTSFLHEFGIDAESREALAFLPVVWVAWSDGTVEPAERALILELAAQHVSLGPEGARALDNWLSFVPDRARVERAAALLVALDMRTRAGTGGDVVDFCRRVAQSGGSLFGRISPPEREAMEAVAHALAVEPQLAWDKLRARLVVESHGALEGWFDDDATNPFGGMPAPIRPKDEPAPAAEGPPGLAWSEGGASAHLVVEERLVIGRGRASDLQLAWDGQLSRAHAAIERRAEGVYLLDLGSLNGCLVNGDRVRDRRLYGGEVIRLGETSFRWRG